MNIPNSKDGLVSYINDLLSSHKNLYILKTVRDKIQQEYNKNKNIAATAPESWEIAEPEPVALRLKRIPEKPVLDPQKNLFLKISALLLKISMLLCLPFVVLFIIVMIMTKFFSTDMAQSGVAGTLLYAVTALILCAVVISVVLKLMEQYKFNEELKSWESVKQRAEEYNAEELAKSEELTKKRQEQYYVDLEHMREAQIEKSLVSDAMATALDLTKSKINSIIYTNEDQLNKLYSDDIEKACRRIDAVFMLKQYLRRTDVSDIKAALKCYKDDIENGVAAVRLSDIFDEKEKYAASMPEFIEFIDNASEDAEGFFDLAVEMAKNIIENAVNREQNKLNQNVVLTEFQKQYADSELALFAADCVEKNKLLLEKYKQ